MGDLAASKPGSLQNRQGRCRAPNKPGRIPSTLRPIFRDRDEFSVGHTLSEQTLEALDSSAALIVLCSPAAAKSHYVNEEIRLFRTRHPKRPVLPVIIDGDATRLESDCFPAALRAKTRAKTKKHSLDLLACDLRESGDGKQLGLAKLVAGLLGVNSDEIFRRAQRSQRRRNRITAAIAASICLLIALTLTFGFSDYKKRQTIADVERLVAKYAPAASAEGATDPQAKSLTEALTAIVEGAATDERYRQALEYLKADQPEQAVPLLKAVAEEKEKRAQHDVKDAAAAYLDLGSIAFASKNEVLARQYTAKAVALDPTNVMAMSIHADHELAAGEMENAERAWRQTIVLAENKNDPISIKWAIWAFGGLELIAMQRGDWPERYRQTRLKALWLQRKARVVPTDRTVVNDLPSAYWTLGLIDFERGAILSSLEYHKDCQPLARERASVEGASHWYQLLGDCQQGVGDALAVLGDSNGASQEYTKAVESYELALSSDSNSARENPDDLYTSKGLARNQSKIAEVYLKQGRNSAALTEFRRAHDLLTQLNSRYPDDASLEYELKKSSEQIRTLEASIPVGTASGHE